MFIINFLNLLRGILTWKLVNSQMHWGVLLLLGGGYAMADASDASGFHQFNSFSTFIKTVLRIFCLDRKFIEISGGRVGRLGHCAHRFNFRGAFYRNLLKYSSYVTFCTNFGFPSRYFLYLKTPLVAFCGHNSMNEKCDSEQTNFERTLICNEKFTILGKQSFSQNSKKTKTKIVFRMSPQKVTQGSFKIYDKLFVNEA